MSIPGRSVHIGNRVASMAMDLLFMSIISVLFWLPMMIKGLMGAFRMQPPTDDFYFFHGPLFYVGLIGLTLFKCKDCLNGRSIAKRILGHQVVHNVTGHAASPLRCLVRNLFLIIWPVEFIVAMVNPERRIGDRVAGTRVAIYDSKAVQPGIKPVQVLLSLLIAYGILFLTVWPMRKVTMGHLFPKDYKETSYSRSESRALEQLFADSLGSKLTASIHIYDSTGRPGVKYIDISCELKDDYLDDDFDAALLQKEIEKCVHSLYPPRGFVGQVELTYRNIGTMRSSIYQIGRGPW